MIAASQSSPAVRSHRTCGSLYVETGDNSYTLSEFGSAYVARSLYLAGKVDASRSTAVVIDQVSYNVSFVPSVFKTTNGITEATMYRITDC
ncbi:hypothetical protein [Paenibacillus sp. PAMC21692]|uniref:hypothetical protein n=1 Tax=Paenibacillus sp. PAMC21692 TaxID=2762320 RepID=UPI00164D7307|nr:hypothetical protein [Paenibacillus sp. PAMC21692]QNK57221.1 hypothetical protein H7F31_32890 [Paenibacillus sp. PAMC21692]